MLSEEEKKAIESFKEENSNDLSRFDDFNSYTQFKVKRDKVIINLIEKQQKEIEELKEKNFELEYLDTGKILENKIKAKIEELENQDREDRMSHNYLVIPVLQSLLEKE